MKQPKVEHDFFDKETERKLLAALMIYPEHIDDLTLLPTDFYERAHQIIYMMLRKEFGGTPGPVDAHLLEHAIDKTGYLEDAGGAGYLSEIVGSNPFPENAVSYTKILQDLAMKRLLYIQTQNLLIDLRSKDPARLRPAQEMLDAVVQTMREAASNRTNGDGDVLHWTQAELYQADFPDPEWLIPDLLPVGLTWVAGRPKIGKSFMALQIACAIGTGGKFLDRDVRAGKVLFIAYEDPGRRLRKRSRDMGIPDNAQITYDISWPTFQDGGLHKLRAAIEGEGYNLVVIDTFSRAAGMANQRDQAEMATMVGGLQNLVNRTGTTIQVLDHHRKQSAFAADPIDDVMEATAKSAVPDTIWGLYSERGKQGATLKVVGRDVEWLELAIQWDVRTCCWQLVGEAGKVQEETMKGQILGVIEDLELLGVLPTTTRIADHVGKSTGYVSHTLADMLNQGLIVKGSRQGRQQPYNIPHKDSNKDEHSKDSKDSKHSDDCSLPLL